MQRAIALAVVFLALILGHTAEAASARKQFDALWMERLQTYDGQFNRANASAKDTAQFVGTELATGGRNIEFRIVSAIRASQFSSNIASRYNVLKDFIDFIRSKPKPEVSRAWLLGRFDRIRAAIPVLEEDGNRVATMRAGTDGVTPQSLIASHERIAMEYGRLDGEIKELALISTETEQYYEATIRESEDRRRARAAIFGSLGAALVQQSQRAQQSWMATCQRFGTMTRCFGN